MIVTTTNDLEGWQVVGYLGIVSGEVILGVNFIKDFGAAIRNVIGAAPRATRRSCRMRGRGASRRCSSGPVRWGLMRSSRSGSITRCWDPTAAC